MAGDAVNLYRLTRTANPSNRRGVARVTGWLGDCNRPAVDPSLLLKAVVIYYPFYFIS